MDYITESFMNLNTAIWKQAFTDEFKCQKARLFYEVTEQTFAVLIKYEKGKRDTFAKYEELLKKNIRTLFWNYLKI